MRVVSRRIGRSVGAGLGGSIRGGAGGGPGASASELLPVIIGAVPAVPVAGSRRAVCSVRRGAVRLRAGHRHLRRHHVIVRTHRVSVRGVRGNDAGSVDLAARRRAILAEVVGELDRIRLGIRGGRRGRHRRGAIDVPVGVRILLLGSMLVDPRRRRRRRRPAEPKPEIATHATRASSHGAEVSKLQAQTAVHAHAFRAGSAGLNRQVTHGVRRRVDTARTRPEPVTKRATRRLSGLMTHLCGLAPSVVGARVRVRRGDAAEVGSR